MKNIKFKSRCFKYFKLRLISQEFNRQVRNKTNKLVREAKLCYYRTRFQDNARCIKDTWKDLRKLATFNARKRSCVEQVEVGGELVSDRNQIVQQFHNYFNSFPIDLSSSIQATDFDPLFNSNAICNSILFIQ